MTILKIVIDLGHVADENILALSREEELSWIARVA